MRAETAYLGTANLSRGIPQSLASYDRSRDPSGNENCTAYSVLLKLIAFLY